MTVERRGKYFHYRFMIDRKLYRGSTERTSLGKAKQFEASLITKIREGKASLYVGKAPLLSEFAQTFLDDIDAHQNIGPKTKAGYHYGWNLLSVRDIAKKRINEIGTSDADKLEFAGLSGSTANAALRTLHLMLSSAERKGMRAAAPRIYLREENERIQLLHPWMEDALLRQAGEMIGDVIRLMRNTGLRPHEVAALERRNVDFTASLIRVVRGKSVKAQRRVGMTQQVREVLSRRLQSGGEWVFPKAKSAAISKRNEARMLLANGMSVIGVARALHLGQATVRAFRDGNALPGDGPQGEGHTTPAAFDKAWSKLLKSVNRKRDSAGLETIPSDTVLYACRHTFATMFLVEGGDVGTLMHLMGHSDIKITMRYVHLVDAMKSATIMDKYNDRKLEIVKKA